jgi:hypothetical protein
MHFAKKLEEHDQIVPVYDIGKMADSILGYEEQVEKLKDAKSVNIEREKRVKEFAKAIDEICLNLLRGSN